MAQSQSTIEKQNRASQTKSSRMGPIQTRSSQPPLSETGSLDQNKSRHAITLNRPLAEVYQLWRDFNNLPYFMKDLERIEILDERRSHWFIRLKNGMTADWIAEITEELPNQRLSWKSEEGSHVSTSGWISFEEATGGRGTVIRLSMDYSITGGKLTEFITFFTGESPNLLTKINLKRFKSWLECGEIPTTEGQSSGRKEEQAEIIKH